MLAHTLFVVIAMTGLKLEWKSPPREANGVSWRDALARLAPMTVVIGLLGLGVAAINANALIWLAPVALPLLLAVPLTVATSHVDLGAWMRSRGVLLIPEESWSPAVLRRAWRHASRFTLAQAV
jgi:membrane glycosyltransferase